MTKSLFKIAVATACLWANPAVATKTTATIGMALEPTHLDPTAGASGAIDEVTYNNIFQGLTRIGADGTVQPSLAKSWGVSADGLTYTFTLQQGVKFHDGTAFNADDVVFSINRIGAENSTNAQKALFKTIQSVTAINPHTVRITVSQPTGALPYYLAWGDAVMVAPESAKTNKTNPIGTGAFVFKNWVRGSHVVLAQNPTYWGKPVALTQATFKFIADPTGALSALMAGDVDAFPNFPAPENIAQLKSNPQFAVHIGTTEGETILSINNNKTPLNNVLVRRAISHAIDRNAIIEGAMFGVGTPIGSHFAPHHPAHTDLTGTYAHNIAKAKQLMAQAGYADGFETTLTLPPPSYARRGGEIVASQLAQIGIRAKIIPVEWGAWIADVFKGKNYDLTIVSHTEPMDIGIYGRDGYYFNYTNPKFKTLMNTLDKTSDTAQRHALLKQAQQMIATDAVNGFMFQRAKIGVWHKNLNGLWHNAPIQANDLTGVGWQ